MTPERWLEIGRLFDEIESLPPADRPRFLDALALRDAGLRDELEALLAAPEPGGASVDGIHDIVGGQAMAYAEPTEERVGRYRIVRRIGQGGMGVVFEAVRVDDFSKRVALKLIRGELQSEALRARFEQERQLLANLEHPFIARLLDGGETEAGGPYLVLEYVDGEPFLDHCARLAKPERLKVFLKVCEAVDYAHRNLVIHRDIKPSNIMVTATADPKLLDFGIAKLIQPEPAAVETQVMALTPAYASPEQIQGRPMAVASDIYSLGVILYRVLTGGAPYDLEGATAAKAERIVCETPPAPPRLGDDLDAILMMALRKEPERRYGSARDLARDIERYLGHLPVQAKADSFFYRARKFIRRRWPALSAGSAIGVAVAAGIVATLYQARLAQDQARLAQARFDQVRALAHAFVFDYGDDLAKIEGTTAVRERMVRTASSYLDALTKSAGDDLGLRRELAAAYQEVGDAEGFPDRPNLGHAKLAMADYAKAAALWDGVVARDPRSAGPAGAFYTDYALLLSLLGDAPGGARASAVAIRDLRSAGTAGVADRRRLAHSWCVLGDFDAFATMQLEKYRRCAAIAATLYKAQPDLPNLKMLIAGLSREADALGGVGRVEESIGALDSVRTLIARTLAAYPHDPELRTREKVLAEVYANTYYSDVAPSLGDIDHAIYWARRYLDIARERVKRDPDDVASRFSLAVALFRLSLPLKHRDVAQAIRSTGESVRLFDRMVASGQGGGLVQSRRARAMRRQAEALLFAGRPDAAAPWAAKALDQARRSAAGAVGADETGNLILALITQARIADARRLGTLALAPLTEAESLAARLHGQSPTDAPSAVLLVRARQALADHLMAAGDIAGAEVWRAAARRPWRDLDPTIPYVRRMLASAAPLPG